MIGVPLSENPALYNWKRVGSDAKLSDNGDKQAQSHQPSIQVETELLSVQNRYTLREWLQMKTNKRRKRVESRERDYPTFQNLLRFAQK